MTNSMKKFIASLVLGSLLLSPATALAATPVMSPATVIKNSLARVFWGKPADHGATITTNIDYTEKDLKNVVVERGYAEVVYDYDLQYRSTGKQNFRFALSLPKVGYTEKGKVQEWKNPIGFEVLALGRDSLHVRVTHVSPEIQALLKEEHVDLSSIIGQWVQVPVEELLEDFDAKDSTGIFANLI